MQRYIFNIVIGLFAPILLSAQITAPISARIYGIVTNNQSELLIGATVTWKDKSASVVTDANGAFRLPKKEQAAMLVVQYVGYQPSEIEVLPGEDSIWVEITGVVDLQTVTVTERGFGNSTSLLNPRNVESISSKELRKAPCCNLSESFETNGAVDVTYANAVTGVKEIQLLGLRGIYSQFLIENRPTMGGIATPFAFEMIPGSWLSGIALAKGASTVKQGYTGITGQINADLVAPDRDKPLFVNLFSSTEGRGEANLHFNKKGETSSHGLLLHGSTVKNKWDRNNDNFYDMPNRSQLNALYRYKYDGPRGCAQFNVQALTDRRESGQIQRLSTIPGFFGVNQRNDRLEAWAKYGKEGLSGHQYRELGNILGASWHRTQSQFGPNAYQAEQTSVYWTTLYQTIIGTTDHTILLAPSLQYDDIQEQVNEQDLSRREAQPGVMAEYTYARPDLDLGIPDLVLVLGARVDWNSRFQQWLFTPRMSAKYNFTTESVLRASAGRGYRSPNLMAENISLLASNRQLNFASDLGLEQAWNYGVNYTQEFKIARRKASIGVDLYRTDFVRQILVDVDQSPTTVFFYNVSGRSFANSFLTVLQYNVLPGLDLKLAYKWQDVRSTYSDGIMRQAPLTARQRGLITVDYTTPNQKWMFNVRTQILGTQRLPDNSQIPHELTHGFPENSPAYSLWNTQVTYKVNPKFEIYIGGENLTNFQQHNAIIAANDPQSPYFNGSQLWAPMGGTIGYVGIRYAPVGL